ncbi:MAG: hypothetical protein EHM28_04570 [Spirochaetaceae bacterium]|nr:MAG: hypothetical protein EHM28_04570 [Spirochaetaceae bacterium]
MQDIASFSGDMKEEAALLSSFASLEDEMQAVVSEKRWNELERIILRFRKKSDLLGKAEEQRIRSFEELKVSLGVPADVTFFGLLPMVAEAERTPLADAYRVLKVAVYAVKGSTVRMGYYFKSVSDTLKSVLGEIFPHRKGKLYSRSGRVTESADASFVLNKHL